MASRAAPAIVIGTVCTSDIKHRRPTSQFCACSKSRRPHRPVLIPSENIGSGTSSQSPHRESAVHQHSQIFTSKTGPIFEFERIHPPGRDVFRSQGCVYFRHAVCITSDPSSIVMKNCPFPISFKKPASEHSFDNF